MVIKRFSLLVILLMTTSALFAQLSQDAKIRLNERKRESAQKRRANRAQLIASAEEIFTQLLPLTSSPHTLTEQQQNEITQLEREIDDLRDSLKTDEIQTRRERNRISANISRRKRRIQKILATNKGAEIELYDALLSQTEKATIAALEAQIKSEYLRMATAGEVREKRCISAYISRLKAKIKRVKAVAVLTFCDKVVSENQNPSEALPVTATAILTNVPLEAAPTGTETFDFASNYFNQINRFTSRE